MRAAWIMPKTDPGGVVPEFIRSFRVGNDIKTAALTISGLGVYAAFINGRRVGKYVLAPGWTVYSKRLQYQQYDITGLLTENSSNSISILLGKGWYRSRIGSKESTDVQKEYQKKPAGLIAEIAISYADGRVEKIPTDCYWHVRESRVRLSEIYDGEIYDSAMQLQSVDTADYAVEFAGPTETLIPQEGTEIREQERIFPKNVLRTPKAETIIDFGQEFTGVVEISVYAEEGEIVDLSFGEMLDKNGNFYNANYRSARSLYRYICHEGGNTYKPILTFYGFRYVRVNEFPGGCEKAALSNFTGIAIYSEMKRMAWAKSGDRKIDQLISNVFWSQKSNFLDVPTDCPQRDERQGWTGDAQVFARTAAYNFDTRRFYRKWLRDLAADQRDDGAVSQLSPDIQKAEYPSAGWGDAITIVPWTLYQAYGEKDVLNEFFDNMRRWVDYISCSTTVKGLWAGGHHYGDWLGLDTYDGSYKGRSRDDLIATAYYAYSTSLLVKSARILNQDPALISQYEDLYYDIKSAFQKTYPTYHTQTECAIAAVFRLAKNPQYASDQLDHMVMENGNRLTTGFIGTPYILYALSDFGHVDTAYSLLLQEQFPSWLYEVCKGATTIWEHWDGLKEDGSFWSSDMNSFNHYAYGAVLGWIYSVCAGIRTDENYPGYQKAVIAPVPDRRLKSLNVKLNTMHGDIISSWKYVCDPLGGRESVRYEITVPVESLVKINGKVYKCDKGTYTFWG